MSRTRLLLVAALLVFTSAAFSQDAHLTVSPSRALLQRSTWAHGYMHGYEAGYHMGNLDLHMLRPTRDPHDVHEYREASHGYKAAFGPEREFRTGYQSGFEVGYLDGAQGREFRAATVAQNLSAELDAHDAAAGNAFDGTFASAYLAGRHNGLSAARARQSFDTSSVACPAPSASTSCDAYKIGYRWGYSDGFANQKSEGTTQRASK